MVKQEKYYQYVLDDMKKDTTFATVISNDREWTTASICFGEYALNGNILTIHNLELMNGVAEKEIINHYIAKHGLHYNEMSYIYHDWLGYLMSYLK